MVSTKRGFPLCPAPSEFLPPESDSVRSRGRAKPSWGFPHQVEMQCWLTSPDTLASSQSQHVSILLHHPGPTSPCPPRHSARLPVTVWMEKPPRPRAPVAGVGKGLSQKSSLGVGRGFGGTGGHCGCDLESGLLPHGSSLLSASQPP